MMDSKFDASDFTAPEFVGRWRLPALGIGGILSLVLLAVMLFAPEMRQEAELKKTSQALKGADFIVTGDVTEFGRKEVGDRQLFGIMGRGKTQVAYAKVTLNIVNVATSEVVFSSQGAGEYSLSNREVLGFGGTASYDATLNGKVLDLAMREAVDRLVAGVEAGVMTARR